LAVIARQGLPSASHHRAGGIVYSFPEASNDIRGDRGRRIATFEPAGHAVGEQKKHIGWPQQVDSFDFDGASRCGDTLSRLGSFRGTLTKAIEDRGGKGAIPKEISI
jgi:hypothetical protein